ncbi:unnamed protein product [Prunus armeniaca]|uniref:Uncharacterized protein n=1 Tax=Prunus armeniaca TaxID=36596 RepID=A0A6J5XQS3_PRUAR|nr:unnamed protein product [Prunus armeniaca]
MHTLAEWKARSCVDFWRYRLGARRQHGKRGIIRRFGKVKYFGKGGRACPYRAEHGPVLRKMRQGPKLQQDLRLQQELSGRGILGGWAFGLR